MKFSTCFKVTGLCLAVLFAQKANAATYPPNFVEKMIDSSLMSPSGMDFAPDGRLFIGQQKGQIRLVKNDTMRTPNVLNIQAKVDYNTERGVMGIALDPNFATNGYLYIYYTANSPISHNRLSRFKVTGDVADTTETILFELPNLPVRDGGNFTSINVTGTTNLSVWHMGGGLLFGSDGKIYLAVGEHEVTASNGAQRLNVLWGKVLRLNPDGSIPTDNPFYTRDTVTGQNKAIWANGLRNPYTMGVQRTTGKIFVNNVGEGTWEDVDTMAAGKNYGWPICEGSHTKGGAATSFCPTSNNFVLPLITYRHGTTTSTGNCAIGGGFTYGFRAQDTGKYFFGDFTNGASAQSWIKSVNPNNGNDTATFATGLTDITGLNFSPTTGDMYYIQRGYATGTIDTGAPYSGSYPRRGFGKVVKVHYTLATGIRPPTPRNMGPSSNGLLVSFGTSGSLRIPEGMNGFQLFDLSGRKVWEARHLKSGESLGLPTGLSHGMLRYRWIPTVP